MTLKRTATIGVVGGALAAWLAAAATSGNRDLAARKVSAPAPLDARGANLASEIDRLHVRLRPGAAPRQPGRNLFRFASAPPRPAPVVSRPALTEPATAPAPPPITLAGIAEDTGPNGPIRTAIISGFGQLFLVQEGANVTPRYRVTRIGADVVELADESDGTTLRLPLK